MGASSLAAAVFGSGPRMVWAGQQNLRLRRPIVPPPRSSSSSRYFSQTARRCASRPRNMSSGTGGAGAPGAPSLVPFTASLLGPSSASVNASGAATPIPLPDSIVISNLSVRMLVGVDSWERAQPQPVQIDVRVHTDVARAGQSDHLPHSLHYGVLVKELERHARESQYRSLEALADGLAKVCIFICHAPRVTLRVQKPRSLLHAVSAGVEIVRAAEDFVTPSDGSNRAGAGPSSSDLAALRLSPTSTWATHDKVFVRDLMISTIVGVNPWEREDKQVVKLNLTVYSGLERLRQAGRRPGSAMDIVSRPHNYRTIVRSISEYVEASSYKTVESLATSIARVAVLRNRVERIRVRVDKPSAIMFADSAGVEVERDRAFFEQEAQQEAEAAALRAGTSTAPASRPASAFSSPFPGGGANSIASFMPTDVTRRLRDASSQWHVVAIALGSNLGDRALNIERAVRALSEAPNCKLVDTSFLYETAPMYVTDQPNFLNGACRIATTLSPNELLSLTQSIETKLGRDKSGVPEKGPRLVDLDIIFYDRKELDEPPRLVIPHPGLKEREFVLCPLTDILPDYEHPKLSRTVSQLLSTLQNSPDHSSSGIYRALPIPAPRPSADSPRPEPTTLWAWGTKTFVMGILNATPDSFSDGGKNFDHEDALASAVRMIEEGADILDVGGLSTAPNAPEISADDEISRVAPLIRAIRARGIDVPISVDTFRASVAQAALEAGANMVNDVSGGERDPAILDVVRRWGVPLVLMHMRGDSKTMTGLTAYEGGDVVAGVRRELEERVDRALKAGVPRWSIILDPGIGFAKDARGNLDLIRDIAKLTSKAGPAGSALASNAGSRVPSRRTSYHSLSALAAGGAGQLSFRAGQQDPAEEVEEVLEDEDEEDADSAPNSSLQSFPLLLGPSRKKFIGTVTGKSVPKDRLYGTIAACAAGIAGGIDIVRVHDVEATVDATLVSDAIFRPHNQQRK